jgi:hypothetical protein
MQVITKKPKVKSSEMTSLLKLSCAIQYSINELVMDRLNDVVISKKELLQLEGLINRLKHEITVLKSS